MTGSPLTETTDSVIASEQAPDERPPTIELGLVVTPVLGAEAVQDLGQSVALELRRRFPDVSWDVSAVREALVSPPRASVRSSTPRARGCWPSSGIWSSTSPSFPCGSHAAP